MKTSLLRLCSILLCLCVASSLCLPVSAQILALSARSAILIDASDTSVLFEKNARERMGMASTTKIMTALVASELLSPDEQIAIPKEAVNVEGSSVYLCEGELLSAQELLYALMLSSANDAAVALAIAASGSVSAFAHKMNEKAREIGAFDTHFVNPHGLYDSEHYTTAYDLALISAAALKDTTLQKIAATKKATIPQGVTPTNPEGAQTRYLCNHNKMLSRYEGAIGLKTGFTKMTGRCLVSAAERDGLRLIAVTLNAPDDWNDHTAMLDYGFSSYERRVFFEVGEFSYAFPITGGKESYVVLTNTHPISLTLPKGSDIAEYRVEAYRRFEFAPVKKGKKLAMLKVFASSKTAESPLVCAYTAESSHKK